MQRRYPLIVLVRHPESLANQVHHEKERSGHAAYGGPPSSIYGGDSDVTVLGARQATATVQYLVDTLGAASVSEARVLCSNQRRALHLALEFQRPFETCAWLQEYTQTGKVLPDSFQNRGERPDSFVERVFNDFILGFLDRIITDESSPSAAAKTHIVIGHSLFFSTALTLLVLRNRFPDWPHRKWIEGATSIDKGHVMVDFHLPNCSISTLTYHPTGWRILGVGKTGHLPIDLQTGGHAPL